MHAVHYADILPPPPPHGQDSGYVTIVSTAAARTHATIMNPSPKFANYMKWTELQECSSSCCSTLLQSLRDICLAKDASYSFGNR